MTEAKEKLKRLSQYMAEQPEVVQEFGRYLAGRLNPQLVPSGFVLSALLVACDLETGIDEFTKEPVPAKLRNLPPRVINLLLASVPNIAAGVLPKDFANAVRAQMTQAGMSVLSPPKVVAMSLDPTPEDVMELEIKAVEHLEDGAFLDESNAGSFPEQVVARTMAVLKTTWKMTKGASSAIAAISNGNPGATLYIVSKLDPQPGVTIHAGDVHKKFPQGINWSDWEHHICDEFKKNDPDQRAVFKR